ncbi:hypothetical protein D3C87_816870 [compost metagenome]|jgi:hypothetical protein|uniref:hypothetical protein n=1 Tax=Pseudomonas TaxID=286 RepID=UPI000BA364EF|nr:MULTISPECIES: hypothetical protein [Pseudomonas]WPN75020.1 hypothetical protein QMK46_01275 [Pseudomonas germanica]
MSKFFDELMESVQEMDEILRRERSASSPTSTPKTDDKTALSLEQKRACYDKPLPSSESALEMNRRNTN